VWEITLLYVVVPHCGCGFLPEVFKFEHRLNKLSRKVEHALVTACHSKQDAWNRACPSAPLSTSIQFGERFTVKQSRCALELDFLDLLSRGQTLYALEIVVSA